MEAIRVARRWTQNDLAAVVGYSQTWVSRVLRGEQALTIEQVRDLGARLGFPLHLLRFGERGGRDNPTKRREFGKRLALAALTGLPPARRAAIDEAAAPTLTAITGAYRRLESATPAHELVSAAEAHVRVGVSALARDHRSPFTPDIAAAAAAFTHSLSAVTPTPKQAAILSLELAELHRQQGDMDQAITLASQALATGRAHASERVIAKARRFRRACTAGTTPAMRAFDRQLHETVPT